MSVSNTSVRVEPYHQGNIVYIGAPGDLGPYAPDKYDCWITLGKAGDFRAFMPRIMNNPALYILSGDSHLSLPATTKYDFGLQHQHFGFGEIKFHRNPEGQLSCVQIHGFDASNPEDAIVRAFAFFHAAMMGVVFKYAAPVNYRGALAIAGSRKYWRAAVRPDYPTREMAFQETLFPSEFARLVGPSYIEGLRSPFSFYALLCFFRIVEFIKIKWNAISVALGEHGLPMKRDRVMMPEYPISAVAPQYLGRKALDVAKDLEKQYRDFVAHLDANDKYPMWSLAGEEHFKVAAIVAKAAAGALIAAMDRDIGSLRQAGMTLESLADLLATPDKNPVAK